MHDDVGVVAPTPRSPGETLTELVQRVTALRNGDAGQVDPLAELYAEDAVVTHPLHPEDKTPILGREELRDHFARAAAAAVRADTQVEDLVIHQIADPSTVIGEFRYTGSIEHRPLNTQCIFVVRVLGGLIVESRDYVDHVASARSYGVLPDLLQRLGV